MPVIVDTDTTRAVRVAAAVGHSSHVVGTIEQLQTWLDRRPNEYAVVLGPEVEMEQVSTLTNRLRLTRPGLSVILMRSETTTDLMAQAMYAGVREVISTDETDSLRESIERSMQTFDAIHGPDASTQDSGKVITVFSPKGGVGKTTTAVNLAVALADNGTNRVALVDLDLAFGDVAITLQLIPEHTIAEAAEVEGHLDSAMLQKLLTRHDSGLMVLAGPTMPDAKDRISPSLVRRVIATLRSDYDYIVVDSSPGFDEQVLAAFDETDECIVLTTLDVPTIKNVKMSLETLDMLNLAVGHRHLVINRADDEVGLTVQNVEGILSMKTLATFPSALDVATATNHGRPIVLSKPDHKVSRSIRDVAQHLAHTEDRAPVAVGTAPADGASKRSLLRRGKK